MKFDQKYFWNFMKQNGGKSIFLQNSLTNNWFQIQGIEVGLLNLQYLLKPKKWAKVGWFLLCFSNKTAKDLAVYIDILYINGKMEI